MTITISINDGEALMLQKQADSAGMSLDNYVQTILAHHSKRSAGVAQSPTEAVSKLSPDFLRAMDDTFREHAELYHRLAQ